MTCRFLFAVLACASAAVAQTPPGDPLTFDIRMPETKLPLRLRDPLDLRRPQLSFSGETTKPREPGTRAAPPKPATRPSPVEMPIVKPDAALVHAMNVVPPKSGVDYKIAIVPESAKAAVAAATPEQPR